jgi:transposase
MIPVSSGVRVWIAAGHTDMRCGMNSLALRIQQALQRDPHAGDLYVFRGKNGKLIKIFWYDGLALTKALMPCAAEHRMIRNPVLDVELAKTTCTQD